MYIFDAITFDTRAAAEDVIEVLADVINEYGYATVYDLYEVSNGGFIPYDHPLSHMGWRTLEGAKAVIFGPKYRLEFPDPIFVDDLGNHKKPNIKPDAVNHPAHYQSETGLEVIDVIEAFTFDLKGIEATDTGNVIKYICRWNSKNGLEDLKKAQWYLNHLISHVEKMKKENN